MFRKPSFFVLLAALCGPLVVTACASHADSELGHTGTLSAPLTSTSGLGFVYRLRNATFSVVGPTLTSIDSEDYLDEPAAVIALSTGAYAIELGAGSSLEREEGGSFVPIEATLTGDAVQSFAIVANQRSTVVFRFQVGDDVLEVGEGGLGVVLQVDEAGEAIPGEEPDPTVQPQFAFRANRLCGLRADRTVLCSDGQDPFLALPMTQISRGRDELCGIDPNYRLACSAVFQASGRDVAPPAGTFQSVAVGSGFACALAFSSGEIKCWGDNRVGQTTPPVTSASQVVAGNSHACALSTNSVSCWGNSSYDQLNVPARAFKSISAGSYHTCGIGTDGLVTCWGDDGNSGLSAPSGRFIQISAGEYFTCGVREDHSLACWGDNRNLVTTPPSGTDFVEVGAGLTYAFARRANGKLVFWGSAVPNLPDDFFAVPVQPLLPTTQAGNWTAIVPLTINGDSYEDLLYYDAATGRAVYTAGTATAGVHTLAYETTYAPGWTAVVPAWHSEDSIVKDLTFYDSVTGNYSAMLATETPGVHVELYSGTTMPGCTSIVPMVMDADGLTDSLCYDSITGKARLSASLGTSNELMLEPGWTTVLPINLNSDADTDLLLYNRVTGAATFMAASGPAVQVWAGSTNFGPGWTTFVPINLKNDHLTDWVRYSAATGTAVFSASFGNAMFHDVRKVTAPGLTLLAPVQNFRDVSQSYLVTFASAGVQP